MRDGPRGFAQNSSCSALLRVTPGAARPAGTGLSPSMARLSSRVPVRLITPSWRPYYPGCASTPPVWAAPRSLAATCGITCCFLFLRVLRCFSSPRLPTCMVCHGCTVTGCPIRTPRGQGLFAPHPGFSQLTASFIASLSLGIHRPPLLAFPFICETVKVICK